MEKGKYNAYKAAFAREKYDRPALLMAKGNAQRLKETAKMKGFGSLGEYLRALVLADCGLDLMEAPEQGEKSEEG